MKLALRPRTFVLSLATLGAITVATALVVACGEMDKTETAPAIETTPGVETTQVSKDLTTVEALVKNLKADSVAATHDALTWLNIPPLTTTSQLSVQSEWAIGNASTATEASKLVWQKSLPTSASAVHSERHLWVRISPKVASTDPTQTRYLDLTQSSGIQQVRTNLDVVINNTPTLQLTSVKLSGTTDEIVLENAPATHPGLALQWSVKVGTAVAGESWYDWAGFTTLLRSTRPTATDLQSIRVRYALADATRYQLKTTFETKPALIQITAPVAETPVDVLSDIKNVLGQIRADVANSVHSGLAWLNVPQIATSWASELQSIEYRTTVGGTSANLEFSDWSTALPSATAFASGIRTLTARITPQRGVSWPVTELDLTSSSEIAQVRGLLDDEPDVRPLLAQIDLSKVQLSSVEANGQFGTLSLRTNNEAALAALATYQVELRFAYQKNDRWLTFSELQSFVETDEAFANYKSGDLGGSEGRVVARLEYVGSDKQITLRDRKTAVVDVRAVAPLSSYSVADRITRLVRRAVVVNTSESTHYNLLWPLTMNGEIELTPAMKAGIKGNLTFTYTVESEEASAGPSVESSGKLPTVTIADYTKRSLIARFTTLDNVVVDLDLTESSQIKKVKRLIDIDPNYRNLIAPTFLLNLKAGEHNWETLFFYPNDTTNYGWNENLFLYVSGSVDYEAFQKAKVQLQARVTFNGKTSTIDLARLPMFLNLQITIWKRAARPGDIFGIERIEVFFAPLDSEHDEINDDKSTPLVLRKQASDASISGMGFTAFTAK